jgi:integrase
MTQQKTKSLMTLEDVLQDLIQFLGSKGDGTISWEQVREWFVKHSTHWAEDHANRTFRRLERDVFPWIGEKPITGVTAPELLSVIQRIEKRGALETAHRALGNCGQVFRYAIATGRAERDPSGDLRGALTPAKGELFAAVTEPKQVAEILRAMARTILDEVLGVRPDFIEHQLAHAVRDPNGRAYNRTAHLPERKKMMQDWADYLNKLKAGVDVIPLRQGA